MRWRLDLAYDGTEFSGWATQPGLRTVQGELETWLPRVLRSATPTPITVAGRTDAGVHARGQVAHFELPPDAEDIDRVAYRLKRVLPADIAVTSVRRADPGFDARFSAIWRRYCYRLWDAESVVDPLRRNMVTPIKGTLDVGLMNEVGLGLMGLRDFAPFCKPRPGATTIRTLLDLSADRASDGSVEVWLRADAFCHSMVRSLIGALVAVASGSRSPDWFTQSAAQTERVGQIHVMPARGLTLEEVGYPPPDQLASRALEARARRILPEEQR